MEIPTFWRPLSMVFLMFCFASHVSLHCKASSSDCSLYLWLLKKLVLRAKSKTGVPMNFPLTNASRRLKIGHPVFLIMWFTDSQLPHYMKVTIFGHPPWDSHRMNPCLLFQCLLHEPSLRFFHFGLRFASEKIGVVSKHSRVWILDWQI